MWEEFPRAFLSLRPPGIPFLQLYAYLFLFFPLLYFSSQLPIVLFYGIIFGWGGIYTTAHQTPHRLDLSMSEGWGWSLHCFNSGQKWLKKKTETGLGLMTDNPVTNLWSSSKGLLSRLWFCDVNGTWSGEEKFLVQPVFATGLPSAFTLICTLWFEALWAQRPLVRMLWDVLLFHFLLVVLHLNMEFIAIVTSAWNAW